jgi:hypothetical protein
MEIPDYDQDPATDEVMSFREAEAAAVEEHLESLAIGEAIHNLLVMAYSGASCGELRRGMRALFAPTTPATGRRAR